MSYTDSPELIASRLRSEISSSESNTRTLIYTKESELRTRIHELEMKLIKSGAFERRSCLEDCLTLAPLFMFFIFVLVICLTGHSHESANTQPTSQEIRSETSTPHAAPAPEEGK